MNYDSVLSYSFGGALLKQMMYVAISATFGVVMYSSFSFPLLLCLGFYIFFLLYLSKESFLRVVCLHSIIISFFYTVTFIHDIIHRSSYTGNENKFVVHFQEPPNIDGDQLKAMVKTNDNEKILLTYRISTEALKAQLEHHFTIGWSCHVKGELSIPEEGRNENSFNYRGYLSKQNVHWILKADAIAWSDCKVNSTMLTLLKNYRMNGIKYINQHFPEGTNGFVAALIFGDQTYIDEDVLASYQRLGIVHLLAISGLHVSFLTGIIFYVGIRIGITRERMMWFMLFLLPIYMILSGAAPSVVRACIMAMLVFAALLRRQKVRAADTIIIVYLFLLIVQPNILFHVGFQLSFAVTFAIVMSLQIFNRYENKLLGSLVVSIVCQLAALPILMYHFFEASLLGIGLNMIYVPLYSALLLPASIMALLIRVLSPAMGDFVIFFLDFLFTLCNQAALLFVNFPLASIPFGKPPYIVLLLIAVSSIILLIKWERKNKAHAHKALLVFLCILVTQYHFQKLNRYGEVIFIDVGQGDAILIKLPFNQGNYLIDTGGTIQFPREAWQERRTTYNTAHHILIPLLKSKGVHELNKLILTHPDADHIGGAAELLQSFSVNELVIASGGEHLYEGKEVLEVAKAKGVSIKRLKSGDAWQVGQAAFHAIHPENRVDDANESSLVLYAKIGGLSWLFTGDLGELGEGELTKRYPKLRTDVLKVGHHGSKTSSSELFIKQLQPKIAIISAGKNNRYGHPHRQVLDALEKENVKVVRTDENGGIIYKYREDSGTFQTVLP